MHYSNALRAKNTAASLETARQTFRDMPSNLPVTVVPGTLAEGFCPENWQELYDQFIDITEWYLAGNYNVFNYGNSTPAPEDRTKPWMRLDGSGIFDRWYTWSATYGKWVSPHPIEASDQERRLWVGSLTDLKLKDGGEDTPVTDVAGPFWEEATSFRARFPLGAGTLPSGTTVDVQDTGGEEKHELIIGELPAHAHKNENLGDVQTGTGGTNIGGFQGTGSPIADINTSSVGSGDEHNNMPPYYGVYFIRRTARKFYALPG